MGSSPGGQRDKGGRCSIARVRYRQLVGGGHSAAALGSRPWGASTPLFAVLHLSLTSPRWARCWSSVGASPRARFVGLAGFPGTKVGLPGGHRAPVGLVFLGSSPESFEGHPFGVAQLLTMLLHWVQPLPKGAWGK